MSVNITSGGVYQILTRYHNGGSVSIGEPGVASFISLVNDVNADTEKARLLSGLRSDDTRAYAAAEVDILWDLSARSIQNTELQTSVLFRG
jgi:hypothetical protein